MTQRSPVSWVVRALRFIALGLGGLVAVVILLVGAALLAVNLPPVRAFAVKKLNAALASDFKGKITIERVNGLHVTGVAGVDVIIQAPDGTPVIHATGVRARIAPIALIASFLRQHQDLRIDVFDIDAKSIDVNVDSDPAGTLKLQAAFEPAQPSSGPPGRPTQLRFPSVTFAHAHVHGQMKGAPLVDADLDHFQGSIQVVPDATTIDVSKLDLTARQMPQGANPHGAVQAHVSIPSAPTAKLSLDASFGGDIGGIPTTAKAAMAGDHLDAVLDVPEVSAAKIRALTAEAPIYQPVSAHVEAHGPMAALRATAHATVGAAQVDVHAEVALAGALAATGEVDLRHLDLRAFSPSSQGSDLGLHAEFRVETKKDGLLAGQFDLAAPPGAVGDQPIPASAFHGRFEQMPGDGGFDVSAQGKVAEPGAPLLVRAEIKTAPPAPVVTFDLRTTIEHLSDVKRFGGLGTGNADVHVAGQAALATPVSLDVEADAVVQGFQHGSMRLGRANLTAHVSGPVTAPIVKLDLQASRLQADHYKFSIAKVNVEGGWLRPNVTAYLKGDGSPTVAVRASVRLGPVITVENGDVDVSRGQTMMQVHVDRLRAAAGQLDVVGGLLAGLGDPTHVALHLRPGMLTIQGESKGIDLKSLGYLLGIEDQLRAGRLAFSADFAARRDGANGTAVIDIDNGCFAQVDGLTGHTDLHLDGRQVTGAITAAAAGIGAFTVSDLRLHIGGAGPLDGASVRQASGAAHFAGQLDLAQLMDLLPPNVPPIFSQLGGHVVVEGDIARASESDVAPNFALALKTSNLTVSGRHDPDVKRNGTILVSRPAWQMAGIDLQVQASATGTTGLAALGVRLVDKEGLLLSFDAKSTSVPFAALLSSRPGSTDLLLRTPVTATLEVPRRKLDHLPSLIRMQGASGEAEAKIDISGSGMDPRIHVDVKARAVKFDASNVTLPLDADFTAKYDGALGDVALDVKSAQDLLLHAEARAEAKASDFLASAGGEPKWTASASAKLSRFPLEAVGPLSDRRLHGTMSGQFALTDLHKDARVNVDLGVDGVRVGRTNYGKASVKAKYDGKAFDANVRLDQEAGFVDAKANLAMRWGASAAPAVDPSGATEITFQAKHFQAGILAPFLQAVMDEFDGMIDADAHVSLRPNAKPQMNGSINFSRGVVELVALGQEFHQVRAKVSFTPNGVVRVDDVSASATSGKVTMAAVVQLDGTSLVGAQMQLKIAKRDAMPLDVGGSDIGTIYGQFNIKEATSADQKTMNVTVDVPSLHVELPEASTHAVQGLGEPPPANHVGVYASAQRFVSLPIDGAEAHPKPADPDASQLAVAVHLGQDVEIKRGLDLKVDLGGDVKAKLAQKTDVTGQIHLRSGKLDVKGRTFEIEQGTVTFVGDPANPEVNVTAGWVAGDGTKVYADYVGPLKTGKVNLRSEPARPQNEIAALLLFGTADGSEATPYASPSADTGTQVGTAVGGIATSGLTQGLNKLTGLDVTAKIDTSQANAPKPEVEVQIAKDISLQLAVVLGTPPPGTNLDTTWITFDWRFFKNWSLETTFGNLGSSIADVVWQRRY